MTYIAGVDDAGRGPVIGPLVIAAVLFDERDVEKLRAIGVRDSKALSPKRRESLCRVIKESARAHATAELSPSRIDEAVQSKRPLFKLNRLEAETMAELIAKLEPDVAYVDSPDINPERFGEWIRERLPSKIKVVSEQKADVRYPVVSAASILAKVRRDELIDQLHKKYGFFGSLPYGEKVLVEENETVHLTKIGELVERKPEGAKAFGFDPRDLKIKRFRITGYHKHPPQRIYKLRLQYGKCAYLSPNHSVFTINRDCEIVPVRVDELKIGDPVAIAGYLPPNDSTKINLADLLLKSSNNCHGIYLAGPIAGEVFERESINRIEEVAAELGYSPESICEWSRSHLLPLRLVAALDKQYLDADFLGDHEGYLRTLNGESISALFLTKRDFMYFLGLYVAKGRVIDSCRISISSGDGQIRTWLREFARSLNINMRVTGQEVTLFSETLAYIIRSLGVGLQSYDRRIPELVFEASKPMISAFWEGYSACNGFGKRGQDAKIISPHLFEQLPYLLLFLKKVTSHGGRGRLFKQIHIFSDGTNSPSPNSLPSVVGESIRKVRRQCGLSQYDLARLSGVPRKVICRIERKSDRRVAKQIVEKFIIAFKERKADNPILRRLEGLITSDLCWAEVIAIEDTGDEEPVYDLEVRPEGVPAENFIGGTGGIILHNSGYPADPRTISFLERWVQEQGELPEFVRRSWETVKRIEKRLGKKSAKI